MDKEVLKNFTSSSQWEALEEILLEEKQKMRDVLNIKGKTREEISIEVKGKQFAVELIDKLFRRIKTLSKDYDTKNKSYV